MQKLIMKHKKYLLFVVTIVLIGILLGIIYYQLLDNNTKNDIINTLVNFNTFKYNAILKNLIILSTLLISSFFGIGIFLSIFYIFYEGISWGFLLNIFYASFKIKGIIYFFLYLLINKLLVFILIVFFTYKIINISRYVIGYLLYKNSETSKKILINFRKCLYSILIIFIIDIVLYYVSPIIFNSLKFLLK